MTELLRTRLLEAIVKEHIEGNHHQISLQIMRESYRYVEKRSQESNSALPSIVIDSDLESNSF